MRSNSRFGTIVRHAAVRARAATAFAAAALSLLGGCAGSGAGLDANGQPLVPSAGGGGLLTADFDSIQTQVFTPICTVCHAGADAPQGLRLDAANSYDLLVGVPSVEVPSLFRVKAGDPDFSYVVQKLEGHGAVGARMPLGGPYLSSDVIAVIRHWITVGALRSIAKTTPASFAIVAVAPAVDDVLVEPPATVMVAFSHELDTTRIDPMSVRIERLVGEGIDATMQLVPARVTVASGNPRALLLWPLKPLRNGHYRVLMRVATPLGMTDIYGEALHSFAENVETTDDSAVAVITTFDVEASP